MILKKIAESKRCHRFLYIIGNPENISTVQNPEVSKLCYLRNPLSLVNENETTQQQVADHLLKAFQITKTKQNEMVRTGTGELPSPVASYLVHAGRLFSRQQPGTYPSQSQRFQSSLAYQRLTPADLDIVKMASLPKINEYSRYDLAIITHLDEQIRYKIFLARKGEGVKVSFVSSQMKKQESMKMSSEASERVLAISLRLMKRQLPSIWLTLKTG